MNHSTKELKLLKALGNRRIALPPVFIDIAGSAVGGIFLAQAWYWSQRTRDGWFYKTGKEWHEETRLSRREQERARRSLRNKGIINERLKGSPAKLYFQVNVDLLISAIVDKTPDEDSDCTECTNQFVQNEQTEMYDLDEPDCTERTNSLYTEITTKITTESVELEAKAEAIAATTHTPCAYDSNGFPTEEAIGKAWDLNKAENWLRYTPGTFNGDTFQGIAFFVKAAGGDREKAIALIELAIKEAAKNKWTGKIDLRLNIAFDCQSKNFIGQYLASALDRKSTSPAAAPAAAPKFTSLF